MIPKLPTSSRTGGSRGQVIALGFQHCDACAPSPDPHQSAAEIAAVAEARPFTTPERERYRMSDEVLDAYVRRYIDAK
jgi:hypothetical protein